MSMISKWRSAAQILARFSAMEKVELGLTTGIIAIAIPVAIIEFARGENAIGAFIAGAPLLPIFRSWESILAALRRHRSVG